MSRFGIISPPVSGHINPFAALGRELKRRGHHVLWFHMEDLAQRIEREELAFHAIGQSDHPKGSLPQSLAALGKLQGFSALRFTIDAIRQTTEMLCRDLPAAVRQENIDALIVDQTEPAGGSVAEHLGLPFITVCNALPLNRDLYAPPPFTPWMYQRSAWSRARNALGYAISDRLLAPVTRVLANHRKRWGLPAFRDSAEAGSRLAQISQMAAEFDFPRESLPSNFVYTGPLRDRRPGDPAFPWDRVDGRPLIYASLGTLQTGKERIFRCFAEACATLPVQLVIAHGGGLDAADPASFPANTILVPYAPQVEVLSRCALTLTHAGLNTILDTLSQGVPAVAVPITYEQPAIAARLVWTGAGIRIAPQRLEARSLRAKITQVLEGASYAEAAGRMKSAIQRAGGVRQAADVIEAALGKAAQK